MRTTVHKRKGSVREPTFARRLAVAMAADGRKDQEIAEAAEVPRDQLSRWKNGRAKPELESVVALVRALGVNGHWLLTGDGDMELAEPDDLAVKLRVVGRVVDGNYLGAIEELTGEISRRGVREDVGHAFQDFLTVLRRASASSQ